MSQASNKVQSRRGMHADGEAARKCAPSFTQAASLRDLEGPALQRQSLARARQDRVRCLEEELADSAVALLGDAPVQSSSPHWCRRGTRPKWPRRPRPLEPARLVDGLPEFTPADEAKQGGVSEPKEVRTALSAVPPRSLVFVRASVSDRNQWVFKRSSRRRPLKSPTKPFCCGLLERRNATRSAVLRPTPDRRH